MNRIDKATKVRQGEALNKDRLLAFFKDQVKQAPKDIKIEQFPGGFSNLTYRIVSEQQEWVLRRPPIGVTAGKAHNMQREYELLRRLNPVYPKCPKALFFCSDSSVTGAPFYVMERMYGVVLRNLKPEEISSIERYMRPLSESLIDQLAALHAIDVSSTELVDLDRSAGYTERQVNGWIDRYGRAKTTSIEAMQILAKWLPDAMPNQHHSCIIHNDYKYDNLLLNSQDLTQIKAVLDWEMATVGDPLCDLGTTLAYWVQAEEEPQLKPFNLSWVKGNLTRQELIARYISKTNFDLKQDDLMFYYVLGLFKVAVIAQQIFARFNKGLTKDKRFASMIYLVEIAANKALKALDSGRL